MARRPRPKTLRRQRRPLLLGFSRFARCVLLSSRSPAPSKPSHPQPRPPASSPPRENGTRDPKLHKISEESEEEQLGTVQVDFGFSDPKPGDFHGVKLLLRRFLDDKPWDLGRFVDLILSQTTVGTVVKLDGYGEDDEGEGCSGDNDDDEGLFAVISVLNLWRYGEHRCIKEIKEFLFVVCPDKSTKTKLKSLVEEKAREVGLLVSQRIANCPYEVVLKLYDALFDEVSWATEDEPTQELRDSFRFKYYLLICRIFENNRLNQRRAKHGHDQYEPIIYEKEEDELFRELSFWSFTFPLHGEWLAPDNLKNYKQMGLVVVVKAEEIPKFREKFKALVAET